VQLGGLGVVMVSTAICRSRALNVAIFACEWKKKLISDKFFQKNLKNDKVRLELEQVASFIEPPAEQVEGLTFFFP